MRRRSYGPAAWPIDDIESPAAWAAGVWAAAIHGVSEVIPAASTVVVRCDRDALADVAAALDAVDAAPLTSRVDEVVVIDAVYDGIDLADVAGRCGLTVDEVINLHSNMTYRVAFCGFSPGFAYLDGLDARLHLDRRSSPRTAVPTGSIAIAAGWSAVYPSPSPGGWHLIGTTSTPVWDLDRTPPAVLQPGSAVRFRRAGP